VKLSDRTIRNAKPDPDGSTTRLWDGGGLYIEITPIGGKLWRFKYRFQGREKLMSLGKYPDVSLQKARLKHQEARTLLADAIDPMEERKADKARLENSFAAVAARWLAHWKEGKSPRHAGYVERRIETDILPRIGHRPIDKIDAPELVAMVQAIADRGVTDLAKRALETVGQIFSYAVAHGYAERNPAKDFKPGTVLPRMDTTNFSRVDARELPDLLRSIEVYRGTHLTRLAMKLMALTFVRTSELIGARWCEFDLDNGRWDIPAERMKMKTPHIVPLSRQAVVVLRTLHTLSGQGEWVFPGDRNRQRPMSNNTILKGLERMGYQGRMTGHGFRGLASTLLHENGFEEAHIELELAHQKRNKVAAAYNHARYLHQRRDMMQWWADYLDEAQHPTRRLERA
jgi:integrase